MSFQRTSSGLSNQYLFYAVDVVVYIEGGPQTYTYAQVLTGSGIEQSEDVAFWQSIFSIFSPTIRYKFKSIGSKSTVNLIADDILQNKISNVYVAMDRDFENIKGTLKISRGVFYTYGYSWENDVWQPEVIKNAFFQLCPVCHTAVNPDTEIQACFDSFSNRMRRVVYVDFLLNSRGLAFGDFRTRPETVFTLDANSKPTINRTKIIDLIQQSKAHRVGPLFAGKKIRFNAIRDCYGHAVDAFGYRLLSYLLKTLCQKAPTLPKLFARTVAISNLQTQMTSGNLPTIFNHYETQFALI